jgi:hypothetical protein
MALPSRRPIVDFGGGLAGMVAAGRNVIIIQLARMRNLANRGLLAYLNALSLIRSAMP